MLIDSRVFFRVLSAAAMAGAVLTSAGCSESRPDMSATKHDADQTTRGTDSWQWISVERDSFQNSLAELLGLQGAEYLPEDNAITQRVQFWLDRIDGQLRADHPDQLANVPTPHANVLKEASANAFVAPVPVCYHVKSKIRSGSATAATTAETVYLDLSTGEFQSWPDGITCNEGQGDEATVRAIVAKFNAAGMDCQLAVSAQGQLSGNSGCSVAEDLDGMVAARNVAVLQTANYVTVHTGIIPMMTEAQLAGVLAHELGHYYRSHITATAVDYNYFYTAEQDVHAAQPTPDPTMYDLGNGAIMSSTILNASDIYRSHNGSYRPELFFAAGSVVLSSCSAGSCPTACTQAKTFIRSQNFKDKIGLFPFGPENTGEAAAYADFETKVGACLTALNLSTTAGTATATAMSWDKVLELVASPVWPSWLGQLDAQTQQAIANLLALTGQRLGDQAPTGATLQDAFVAASATIGDQDSAAVAQLREAQSRHLGYYTIEEEADDESAEWTAETGLDPKAVVEAMHALGEGSANGLHGMSLGEQDCDALWNNGWLDNNGGYVFVPIGDYSEIHHSVCYRMFNLEREIAAHNHVASPNAAPVLTAAEWSDLQEAAESLNESTGGTGGGNIFHMAPIAKKKNVMQCPYAHSYH